MSARPIITLQTRWPIVGLLLLLVPALLIPGRVWTTLLIGLGGLLLFSYLWARQLARSVRAARRLRFGWVAVGDRLSEQFELTNSSFLPALWVEVDDRSNVPGYGAGVVRSLGGHAGESWRQSAVCLRRGRFHLGPWSLLMADPFGLFQVRVPYDSFEEVIIHPPVDAQLPIPLPPGRSSGRARASRRSMQATVNAAAVREYAHGDPLRWIHWPSSARHSRLLVRQFDLDAAGDVWLALDMQGAVQLGHGPDNTVEQAVLTAAALSAQALQRNRGVGLASYGRQPQLLPPAGGEGQLWKLLRGLALVEADGETPLSRALADLAGVARRGSAVLVITPSANPDWLPALLDLTQRGVQVHVILQERAGFGGEGDSHALYELVRRTGFPCDLLGRGDIRRQSADQERRGFWEFRTTATGKVIVLRRPEMADAG